MIKEIWLGTAHADGSGKEREGGKRDQPGPGAGSGVQEQSLCVWMPGRVVS